MTDRSLAVQKAVFDALVAAGLTSASGAPVPVYDHAPQDATMPFVDIVSHQVLPNEQGLRPLASPMAVHNVILAVWSNYRGQKEVLGILARIRDALDGAQLTLSAGTAVLAQISSTECRVDADGVTYQGAATLRIIAV